MQDIIIIGLGSQGLAWAQNLRDSGRKVTIALRADSASSLLAKEFGLDYFYLGEKKLAGPQNILLLVPDHEHQNFFHKYQATFADKSRFIYAHGYSFVQFKWQERYPQWEHLLLAPKAIASEVRNQYQIKGKLGGVYSVEAAYEPTEALHWIKALARDLGVTHLYEASFTQETTADLFSEQSLLCSLLPYGALKSYEKLRALGIPPELAYMECWVEMKLIVDTMVKLGPLEFFKMISPNALMGGEKAYELLFDKEYQKHLDKLLTDIQTGEFAKQCEQTDFAKLKSQILARWEESEFTQTHRKLNLT